MTQFDSSSSNTGSSNMKLFSWFSDANNNGKKHSPVTVSQPQSNQKQQLNKDMWPTANVMTNKQIQNAQTETIKVTTDKRVSNKEIPSNTPLNTTNA